MHWAIGTFCLGSAGMFEFCQRRRALEKQGMARAAEIIDQKKLTIEKERERVRAERRKRKEEEDRAREEKEREKELERSRSWKFWRGG
jgi:cytochrome c oxidase assembly protein subunit 20